MSCRCESCTHLYAWPEMPYMDPPSVADIWNDPEAEWTVACNWLGPLIDGSATLIRRGLTTDGGTIPRPVWPVVGHPLQMPFLAYFLCHDADYSGELRRRAVADARLYKGAALDGHINTLKLRTVYRAVRIGGGGVWKKHTPQSVERARRFCRAVGAEEYAALLASRRLPVMPASCGPLPDTLSAGTSSGKTEKEMTS